MTAPEFFIDNNRGNDSNTGLSKDDAWKTLAKLGLGAARAAGTRFMIEAESEYDYDLATRLIPTNWSGTEVDPITIGRYSYLSATPASQLPTIRWNRRITAGQWTYSAPNNAWYHDAPHTIGPKCLVRINDGWLGSQLAATGGLPLDSVDGRYQQAGSRLWLYAPAGQNPTAYYGDVLLSTMAGFFTLTDGRGWVTVEDLSFEDTGTGILAYSNTAADVGLLARRIRGRNLSSVIQASCGASGLGQLYVTIRDCDFENWGSCALSAYTPTGAGAALKRLEAINNRIHDGMHCYSNGAIHWQARSLSNHVLVKGNTISKVRHGTLGKPADGAAIYFETESGGAYIIDNLIYDAHLAFQDNSGRAGNVYSGNFAYNVWAAMKITDQSNNDMVSVSLRNNTFLVGDTSQVATFGDGAQYNGLMVFKSSGTTPEIDARNNVFAMPQGATSEEAAIVLPSIGWAGDLSNNAAQGFPHNAQGGSPLETVPVTGWVTGDLDLPSTGVPRPGGVLSKAGVQIGNRRRRDMRGVQDTNPPTIGAFAMPTFRF